MHACSMPWYVRRRTFRQAGQVDGAEAFLCWQLGEDDVAYWHGLEEGFAGRKPLDP